MYHPSFRLTCVDTANALFALLRGTPWRNMYQSAPTRRHEGIEARGFAVFRKQGGNSRSNFRLVKSIHGRWCHQAQVSQFRNVAITAAAE